MMLSDEVKHLRKEIAEKEELCSAITSKINKKEQASIKACEEFAKKSHAQYLKETEKDMIEKSILENELDRIKHTFNKQQRKLYRRQVKKLMKDEKNVREFIKNPDRRLLNIPFEKIFFYSTTGKRLKLGDVWMSVDFDEEDKFRENRENNAEIEMIGFKLRQANQNTGMTIGTMYRQKERKKISGYIRTFAEFFVIRPYDNDLCARNFCYESFTRPSYNMTLESIFIDVELTLTMLES